MMQTRAHTCCTNHPHENTNRSAATEDANCNAYEHLCGSGRTCGMALQTERYKKAKGKPPVDCCSAAYGGIWRGVFALCWQHGGGAGGPVSCARWRWLPAAQGATLCMPD
jgi:hypothetical protein